MRSSQPIPRLGLASLSALERLALLWLKLIERFVLAPLTRPRRGRISVAEGARIVGHLYRSEARLARAIYKAARRMAGLPRIPCPLDAFIRPPARTVDSLRWRIGWQRYNLIHARDRAIRMAWRWKRDNERRALDPLWDLRGDLTKTADAFLPQSRRDWGRWIGAQRQDGGGSPAGILGARAPPVGCIEHREMHHRAACAKEVHFAPLNAPYGITPTACLADPSARSRPHASHAPS